MSPEIACYFSPKKQQVSKSITFYHNIGLFASLVFDEDTAAWGMLCHYQPCLVISDVHIFSKYCDA